MASTGFQEWRFNQGLSSVFFYTLLKQKCTVRFMCRQLAFSSAVFISQIFYDCSMFTFFICRAAHEHTPFFTRQRWHGKLISETRHLAFTRPQVPHSMLHHVFHTVNSLKKIIRQNGISMVRNMYIVATVEVACDKSGYASSEASEWKLKHFS